MLAKMTSAEASHGSLAGAELGKASLDVLETLLQKSAEFVARCRKREPDQARRSSNEQLQSAWSKSDLSFGMRLYVVLQITSAKCRIVGYFEIRQLDQLKHGVACSNSG